MTEVGRMVFPKDVQQNGLQSEMFSSASREELEPALDNPGLQKSQQVPDEPPLGPDILPWNKWAVVLSHCICGNCSW